MVVTMNGAKNHASSPFRLLHLPRDLLFNCLGRVSRLYHPTLSLVSKRLRSLLASNELYAARTRLGRTESCLYVCLTLSPSDKPRWFTLCRVPPKIRNPNPNPNPNSRGNLMVSISTQKDSPACWHDLIAVGSDIYMIGGFIDGAKTSSRVYFMDCRSHTWHKAPSMGKALNYAYASVLDGKIYVAGGCKDLQSSNLIEFFDLETQKWEHVLKPEGENRWRCIVKSLVIEERLYLFGDNNVVYKPNENKWDAVEPEMRVNWNPNSYCVVDNILYNYRFGSSSRRFKWYDSEERLWRDLKGLGGLPKIPQPYSSVRLVNSGGKIAVFWDEIVLDFYKKKIWCAEIAVERRSEHEIYGMVEWCEVVHIVSKTCNILKVISVTL